MQQSEYLSANSSVAFICAFTLQALSQRNTFVEESATRELTPVCDATGKLNKKPIVVVFLHKYVISPEYAL